MKRIKKYFVFTLLLTILMTLSIRVDAADSSLTGPSVVRAGDTIILALNINGADYYGIEGEIEFDSSQLSLSSVTTDLSGWQVDTNENKFVVYDDSLTKPLSGLKTVINLKFYIVKKLTAGTSVEVSVKNIIATDGTNEKSFSTVTYKTNITAPKSDNCNISKLTISNATLSPSFSSDVTSYKTTVNYAVKSLDISVTTSDKNATYKITGNSLSVGDNTVKVTVTSENGTNKVYTINIKREQDENYVPSNDAKLKSISISAGILSPAFDSGTFTYLIYVPFETSKLSISGKAEDGKAKSVTSAEYDFKGSEPAVITCQAEDGTKQDYRFYVLKLPLFKGIIPEIIDNPDNPDESSEPSEVSDTSDNSEISGTSITGEINIMGTPAVGETLTASANIEPSGADVVYAWYADGQRVGEGKVYNVSLADVDKKITVMAVGINDYTGEVISAEIIISGSDESAESSDTAGSDTNVESETSTGKTADRSAADYVIWISSIGLALIMGFVIGYIINKRKNY